MVLINSSFIQRIRKPVKWFWYALEEQQDYKLKSITQKQEEILLQDTIVQLRKTRQNQGTGLADCQDMQAYSDLNQALEDTGNGYI